jgi:hypothetical protein
MGLDMYLYRQQYVSGYEFQREDEKNQAEVKLFDGMVNLLGITPAAHSPHMTAEVCVGYWRKANAIHKWFCDLDGGKDECQKIPVSVEQLRELRNLCDRVLLQPAAASEILPTQSGFFFGSYDYDEWYMQDMKNTVTMLDEILKNVPLDANPWDYSFTYQASW